MHADGRFVVTKAAHTGGCVDRRTVTEQLLYELHDPAAYLTPDVVADINEVQLYDDGSDRIEVRGIRGHARPPTLKATLCYEGGCLGEGEISYAGPNATARARLAGEIVRERLRGQGLTHMRTRCDLIGVASVSPTTMAVGLIRTRLWRRPTGVYAGLALRTSAPTWSC